jgi:type III secretion protein S
VNGQALELTREALWLVLLLSGPPIAAASVVGIAVAILQAVTQVQEQTVQFLLKFVAVALAIIATSAALGGALYHFADRIFLQFPEIVG